MVRMPKVQTPTTKFEMKMNGLKKRYARYMANREKFSTRGSPMNTLRGKALVKLDAELREQAAELNIEYVSPIVSILEPVPQLVENFEEEDSSSEDEDEEEEE